MKQTVKRDLHTHYWYAGQDKKLPIKHCVSEKASYLLTCLSCWELQLMLMVPRPEHLRHRGPDDDDSCVPRGDGVGLAEETGE